MKTKPWKKNGDYARCYVRDPIHLDLVHRFQLRFAAIMSSFGGRKRKRKRLQGRLNLRILMHAPSVTLSVCCCFAVFLAEEKKKKRGCVIERSRTASRGCFPREGVCARGYEGGSHSVSFQVYDLGSVARHWSSLVSLIVN